MKKIFTTMLTASLLSTTAYSQWTQQGASMNGTASEDQLGKSVSLSADGNIMAIGADMYIAGGTGRVEIYEWSGSAWALKGDTLWGTDANGAFGWSTGLSADGNRIVVGSRTNSVNASNAGKVEVYDWNGSAWNLLGSAIYGQNANDYFGATVDINSAGDIIAVGAYRNDANGSNAGAVYVYQVVSGNLTQIGQTILGDASGDQMGFSVSLDNSGTVLAIGATKVDGNGSDAGAVKVYTFDGTNWVLKGSIINGEAGGDQSGYSVSLSGGGDTVAIGAIGNGVNGTYTGHVRVYAWDGSAWNQVGADIDGDVSNDFAGASVSLNDGGNYVAVGAVQLNGGPGLVRVYKWDGSNWTQEGADINGSANGDRCGTSVCLNSSATILATGSARNGTNGANSGQARAFSRPSTVGIDDIAFKNNISIYPNPVKDYVSINLQNNIVGSITITDITGRVVYRNNTITTNTVEVPTANYKTGMYFITVQNNKQKEVIKFIKQ